jgi:hypothetical protein
MTAALVSALLQAAKTYDFEKDEAGKAPAGFTQATTGGGAPGAWAVREEAGAPSGKKVLAQTSQDETDLRFPLCVLDAVDVKDSAVSVKFKAVSGKVDQAAGLVLRFKDKDNYYVARANALEDNVRLYKVETGKRKQFAGKNGVKVAPAQWHALRLEVKGSHFKVSFNGELLFEADDAAFAGPGKAGLWTKADSVTLFDDFSVEAAEAK